MGSPCILLTRTAVNSQWPRNLPRAAAYPRHPISMKTACLFCWRSAGSSPAYDSAGKLQADDLSASVVFIFGVCIHRCFYVTGEQWLYLTIDSVVVLSWPLKLAWSSIIKGSNATLIHCSTVAGPIASLSAATAAYTTLATHYNHNTWQQQTT